MAAESEAIIGIDGGGTYTRVVVSDLSGRVLAYCEKGGASIYRNAAAAQNVRAAIAEALDHAGISALQVAGMAAGIAGYDEPSDLEWVTALTDVPELPCPKWHVNDAWIAHYGALLAKPGIIVISGTGSIIVGITEQERYLRNYDYHHYAASAARFIAYDAVFEVLAGNTDESDASFVENILKYWNATSLSELSAMAQYGFAPDKQNCDKRFGLLAPLVTEAAGLGSSAAIRVCDRAVHQIKVGIELLASAFSDDRVQVAFIGGVANSSYIYSTLCESLKRGNNKQFTVTKPVLPPAAGAVLYAMNRLKLPVSDEVVRSLQQGLGLA